MSSLLAGGLTLDEIPYWRDGTLQKYTPSGEYVVVKFARWAFEKFKGAEDKLGTQMRAVGEVMSIGKNYKEAFHKAIRSLEQGRYGLGYVKNFNDLSLDELLVKVSTATSERQFIMYEAIRKGASLEVLHEKTHIKAWFIEQMAELVELEERILEYEGRKIPDELLTKAKKDGFSDCYLAQILDTTEAKIRKQRTNLGVVEGWEPVRVSGVEDAAYYFSTYNAEDKVGVSENRKIMVLGGGPNRIGQGIEFDYCCVHAAFTLRDEGFETIMVNCNPETVSTDYDTSDKLYFEPLTVEDVLSNYEKEKPEGVIVQFGGQTPLNIARQLEDAGVKIIGTTPETIDLAEADADGTDAFVPAVMEHIELAGVHSGDSACVSPPVSIPEEHLNTIREYTKKIAIKLKVVGLMNMQYAIADDTVYVLEANPRASRTVPLVSKVCGISMARAATQIMLGKKLTDLELKHKDVPYFGVKEAVFPFNMFQEVDPLLGPEMRSTGEVLGLADSYGLAFFKAQEATQQMLPSEGTVLISVANPDKTSIADTAKAFTDIGFKILATEGTHEYLSEKGIESERILKVYEGRPNIVDAIMNKEIQLVINTPIGKQSQNDDSYIRKAAIKYKIPYITTATAAAATANGIAARQSGQTEVRPLQEYHAALE